MRIIDFSASGLSHLRREYETAALDEKNLKRDPLDQLTDWIHQAVAAHVREPNAMVLCTVNEHGAPSARMVLLKQIIDDKLIFFSNYRSRKGKELETNPQVALLFYWAELERQVRIEGTARKADAEQAERYFRSRPREAQLSALVSPQSDRIESRRVLEELVRRADSDFKGKEIARPEFWGGYEIMPLRIEFWQGRKSRLHDRILFSKSGAAWEISRLAP